MELNKIYNEDCRLTLGRISDQSIDLLLQDTPFGVTQNKWDIKPNLSEMWKHWLRVGKETTPFIFFATMAFAADLIASMPKLFKYDLVWYKALGSGHLNANIMPMRNHENILVFYRHPPTFHPQMGVGIRKKGIRKADRNGTNYGKFAVSQDEYFDDKGARFPQSVLDFTNGDRAENSHPNKKPIDLIRYLILTYSNPGDLVFDGYSGSGTTAAACIKEGRNFICSETDDLYYDNSIKRIRAIPKELSL